MTFALKNKCIFSTHTHTPHTLPPTPIHPLCLYHSTHALFDLAFFVKFRCLFWFWIILAKCLEMQRNKNVFQIVVFLTNAFIISEGERSLVSLAGANRTKIFFSYWASNEVSKFSKYRIRIVCYLFKKWKHKYSCLNSICETKMLSQYSKVVT